MPWASITKPRLARGTSTVGPEAPPARTRDRAESRADEERAARQAENRCSA
jgi:hypothetical protein